jgi:hypothetical protein
MFAHHIKVKIAECCRSVCFAVTKWTERERWQLLQPQNQAIHDLKCKLPLPKYETSSLDTVVKRTERTLALTPL